MLLLVGRWLVALLPLLKLVPLPLLLVCVLVGLLLHLKAWLCSSISTLARKRWARLGMLLLVLVMV